MAIVGARIAYKRVCGSSCDPLPKAGRGPLSETSSFFVMNVQAPAALGLNYSQSMSLAQTIPYLSSERRSCSLSQSSYSLFIARRSPACARSQAPFGSSWDSVMGSTLIVPTLILIVVSEVVRPRPVPRPALPSSIWLIAGVLGTDRLFRRDLNHVVEFVVSSVYFFIHYRRHCRGLRWTVQTNSCKILHSHNQTRSQ